MIAAEYAYQHKNVHLAQMLLRPPSIDLYLRPDVLVVGKFAKGKFAQSAVMGENIA